MNEKSSDTKRKTWSVKRLFRKIRKPISHFVETIWAIGVGLVAAMVTPFPIYLSGRGTQIASLFFFDVTRKA